MQAKVKKWWWAIAAAIILLTVLWFFGLLNTSMRNSGLVDAVPSSAAIFFEVKDFGALQNEIADAPYLNDLRESKIGQAVEFLQRNKNLLLNMPTTSSKSSQEIISIHSGGKNGFSVLLLRDISAVHDFSLQKQLDSFRIHMPRVYPSNYEFESEKIYQLNWPGKDSSISLAQVHHLLMLATSPSLIEDAIMQLKNAQSLRMQTGFKEVYEKANSNFQLSMFLNFNNLSQLLAAYAKPGAQGYLNAIGTTADWMQTDLSFSGDAILFSGSASPQKSNNIYTDAIAFEDVFSDSLAAFLKPAYQQEIAIGQNQFASNRWFTGFIKPWIGQSMTFFLHEPFGNNDDDLDWTLEMPVAGGENATNSLDKISEQVTDSSNSYKKVFIKALKPLQELNTLFPNPFSKMKNVFWCETGRHVFFSGSEEQMMRCIDAAQSIPVTKASSENFSWRIALDLGKLNALLEDNSSLSNLQQVESFSPAQFNFVWSENVYSATGKIFYQSADTGIRQLWQIALDTSVAMPPTILVGREDSQVYAAAQDSAKRLYLVSKSGNVVWKKTLDEFIIGTITAIDYFNNGSTQLICNTQNQIHCFNLDGNEVTGFPIELSFQTNLPMQFITARASNLMFLVSTDGSIYGFDRGGKPLPNWNPKPMNAVLPVQSIVLQKGEPIIAIATESNLQLFNVNGNSAAKPIEISGTIKSLFVSEEKQLLTVMDNSGTIYRINGEGKTSRAHFRDFESDVDAQVYDLNNDAAPEYVLLDVSNLFVYKSDSSLLFQHDFKNWDERSLQVVEAGNKNFIATQAKGKREIDFFNEEGKEEKGFPLKGDFAPQTFFTAQRRLFLISSFNDGRIVAYLFKP